MKKDFIALCLCLFLISPLAYGFEKIDMKLDKKILEAGKTQYTVYEYKTEGKGVRKRGISVILVDAPPDEVWAYICDYNGMREYVPYIDRYETVQWIRPIADGEVGESLVNVMTDLPVFKSKWCIHVIFDGTNKYQNWVIIKKPEAEEYIKKGINVIPPSFGIKDVNGCQYVEPYEDGKKTLLYYASSAESFVPVPRFLQNLIMKAALNDFLVSIKKRVESNGTYKK
ncbi:MAG: SRPBCC family protein [Proteobacteria bacterium]|nr:SRPBCC family protein [Pseudomonadota bacterium]